MDFKHKCKKVKQYLFQYVVDQSYLYYCNQKNYYRTFKLNMYKNNYQMRYDQYLNRELHKEVEALKRIQLLDNIEQAIGEEYYVIILNDFIYREKNWYYDYYSKATYYRKKHLAVDAFLDYVEMFNK